MKTFKASFCDRHRCPASSFARKVLWRTLPAPLLPFAFVWCQLSPTALTVDLRLIEFCGESRDLNQVRDEIAGYFSEAYCWGFVRRRLHFRISTNKLKRLAREYLQGTPADEGGAATRFIAAI